MRKRALPMIEKHRRSRGFAPLLFKPRLR